MPYEQVARLRKDARASIAFWPLLRVAQTTVVVQAVLDFGSLALVATLLVAGLMVALGPGPAPEPVRARFRRLDIDYLVAALLRCRGFYADPIVADTIVALKVLDRTGTVIAWQRQLAR